MSYIDTSRRPSYRSMVAVVAIHGALGLALVYGLTESGVIPKPDLPMPTFDFTDPPPPEPKTEEAKPQPTDRKIVTPLPPLDLKKPTPPVDTTTLVLPQQSPVPQPGKTLTFTLPAIPAPAPMGPASGAKPRNDPARWVDTDDYKSNWIRREMTGKARFRLEIAADGKVTNCTITGSSGHPELDAATCALVSKRAKFQPARSSDGEAVAGSYSNAIDWRLPE